MKYLDAKTGQEVTFLDCEGGRAVVDENGDELYLFYSPAKEPTVAELIRSLPKWDGKISEMYKGDVGKVMNIEFVKEFPCPA